jgi:hypothetical protein
MEGVRIGSLGKEFIPPRGHPPTPAPAKCWRKLWWRVPFATREEIGAGDPRCDKAGGEHGLPRWDYVGAERSQGDAGSDLSATPRREGAPPTPFEESCTNTSHAQQGESPNRPEAPKNSRQDNRVNKGRGKLFACIECGKPNNYRYVY